jgi:thymidine kinase
MTPVFIVFTGPMFASKTTRLLLAVEQYKYQGVKVAAFKPAVDTRYSATAITSHAGWSLPATPVKDSCSLSMAIMRTDAQVIAVDEAFMLTDCSSVLIDAFWNLEKTVLVSSIELDATGKPFAEVAAMLPYATRIEKCTAVCVRCRGAARYSHRKSGSDAALELGGQDAYEALCLGCFNAALNKAA